MEENNIRIDENNHNYIMFLDFTYDYLMSMIKERVNAMKSKTEHCGTQQGSMSVTEYDNILEKYSGNDGFNEFIRLVENDKDFDGIKEVIDYGIRNEFDYIGVEKAGTELPYNGHSYRRYKYITDISYSAAVDLKKKLFKEI